MADLFSMDTLMGNLWIMPIIILFFGIMYMIYSDSKSAKKAFVLRYVSEKQAEILDLKVKDGILTIGKEKHYVDEDDATLIKGTGYLIKAFRPLYVIKWNSVMPQSFTKDGIKALSPENLENFLNNKTLAQLLTPKDADKKMILMVVAGLVMGGLLMYTLISSGVIKLGG